MWCKLVVLAAWLAAGGPASSQEWIIGAGYADLSDDRAKDSSQILLEYRHSPFYGAGRFDAAFAASAVLHSNGDFFAGAGLSARYAMSYRWFVDVSVMPGAYLENDEENNLGSTFEIRSLLALGYYFNSSNRWSLGVSHKSNASTAASNPGVNSLVLRWHTSF